jgi:hypothetical protein
LGLVTAEAPEGSTRLVFQFGPTTPWLLGGALATLSGLLWSVLAWQRRRGAGRGLRVAAIVLVVLCVVLMLNGLGLGRRMSSVQPTQVALGDVAVLLGWDAAPARGTRAMDITLYWFSLREVGTNLKSFVHVLGEDGQVLAQHDGDPVGGFTPTSRWLAGEIIADRHRVQMPLAAGSGEYALRAGMYTVEPLRNLPTDPATPDGRADLGRIRLTVTPDLVQSIRALGSQ